MSRQEFEEFFNARLKDLKESINEDMNDIAMHAYYRGKCVGLLLLAFEIGVIDLISFDTLRDKVFDL